MKNVSGFYKYFIGLVASLLAPALAFATDPLVVDTATLKTDLAWVLTAAGAIAGAALFIVLSIWGIKKVIHIFF